MPIEEIRAEIAKNEDAIAKLQTELRDGEDVTDERIKELEDEVKNLTEKRSSLDDELKKAEKEAQEKRSAVNGKMPVGKLPNGGKKTLEEVRSSDEYALAFAEYVKTGDDAECRTLLTDLVDGTVPIPTMISNVIETAWTKTNIVQRLRRTNLKGIARYPFEFSATGASIHVEGEDRPREEELELGSIEIRPQTIKKWIRVSDEVLALKGMDFLNYINAEITQRILELADKIAVDTIKANPAVATKEAAGVPVLNIDAITFATIFKALALLADGATHPVAIMNKQTYFNTIMCLTDLQERPIYNVVADNGKPQYYINGVEVLFNENLDADTEIIVGDFDGMIVNLPEGDGVKFVTDPYSEAEYDLVKIVGRMMAGFGVVRDKYFVKVVVGGTDGGNDGGNTGGNTGGADGGNDGGSDGGNEGGTTG